MPFFFCFTSRRLALILFSFVSVELSTWFYKPGVGPLFTMDVQYEIIELIDCSLFPNRKSKMSLFLAIRISFEHFDRVRVQLGNFHPFTSRYSSIALNPNGTGCNQFSFFVVSVCLNFTKIFRFYFSIRFQYRNKSMHFLLSKTKQRTKQTKKKRKTFVSKIKIYFSGAVGVVYMGISQLLVYITTCSKTD